MAGISEILFGVVFLLMSVGMTMFLVFGPRTSELMDKEPFPLIAACAIYGLLGALAVVTAIGVFRGLNWARLISIVAGAMLAIFCTLIGIVMIFIPLPAGPGQQSGIRFIMSAIFLVPALFGAWWVILFTRPRIVEMFKLAEPSALQSRRPLSITVIAGFYLFSAIFAPIFQLFQHAPASIFGFIVPGIAGSLINLTWAVVSGIIAIGLFRLDRRAWLGMFALLGFGALNGLAMWMLPGRAERFAAVMRSSPAYQKMDPAAFQFIQSPWYGLTVMALSMAIPAYFLYTRRAAFEPAPAPADSAPLIPS